MLKLPSNNRIKGRSARGSVSHRRDGNVIYVSPAGTVFGVSAHANPNLHQLLGNSNLQQGDGVRAVTIQDNDFMFTNFGRMMNSHGRAQVSSLTPTSLTPQVVH